MNTEAPDRSPATHAAEGVLRSDVQAVNSAARRVLYKAREPIYPKAVHGTFRKVKWAAMAILLAIYYIVPFIRWDRGVGKPDQAVLVDLDRTRFYFFWIELWPQEVYFIAGLLIVGALGLFLFTALFGRVWCGYACPQTVWTDLYIAVERWIEGDRSQRIRLAKEPWSAAKIGKRVSKHAIWLLIAVATGGAWVLYFYDAPTFLSEVFTGSAPFMAYVFVGVLTFTTYSLAGFMREQVCTYMCPWPRIQAAMVDAESISVTYLKARGEPRGPHKKGSSWDGRGDCIDCNQCVAACPMGIDIRDGDQLECINCGLCIDACDEVMDRIDKPRGLISYMALKDEVSERAGGHPKNVWKHIFRPRTLLYTTLWAGIGVGMIVALFLRSPIGVNVTPVRNPLYVTLADGTIRNTYEVRLHNKHGEARPFHISVTAEDPLQLSLEGKDQTVVEVPADATVTQRVYVTAAPGSKGAQAGRVDLRIWVVDLTPGTTDRVAYDTVFNGKGK